jgi:hypothetical protein
LRFSSSRLFGSDTGTSEEKAQVGRLCLLRGPFPAPTSWLEAEAGDLGWTLGNGGLEMEAREEA